VLISTDESIQKEIDINTEVLGLMVALKKMFQKERML
jgi:hypothetical protein